MGVKLRDVLVPVASWRLFLRAGVCHASLTIALRLIRHVSRRVSLIVRLAAFVEHPVPIVRPLTRQPLAYRETRFSSRQTPIKNLLTT